MPSRADWNKIIYYTCLKCKVIFCHDNRDIICLSSYNNFKYNYSDKELTCNEFIIKNLLE